MTADNRAKFFWLASVINDKTAHGIPIPALRSQGGSAEVIISIGNYIEKQGGSQDWESYSQSSAQRHFLHKSLSKTAVLKIL